MTPEGLQELAPLVRKIAREFVGRVPATVEVDDLVQVGLIAVWQASTRFDTSLGLKFSTFATHRVRGAMLDELRAYDPLSREHRARVRAVSSAAQTLEHTLGRQPTLGELAQATGLSIDECSLMQVSSSTCSLDDVRDVAGADTPHEQFEQRRRVEAVVEAIEKLSDHERLVIEQHVGQDRTFLDIAGQRGITEGGVAMAYRRAVKRLQSKLWAWQAMPPTCSQAL